jgi:hypothetical protein
MKMNVPLDNVGQNIETERRGAVLSIVKRACAVRSNGVCNVANVDGVQELVLARLFHKDLKVQRGVCVQMAVQWRAQVTIPTKGQSTGRPEIAAPTWLLRL